MCEIGIFLPCCEADLPYSLDSISPPRIFIANSCGFHSSVTELFTWWALIINRLKWYRSLSTCKQLLVGSLRDARKGQSQEESISPTSFVFLFLLCLPGNPFLLLFHFFFLILIQKNQYSYGMKTLVIGSRGLSLNSQALVLGGKVSLT